MQPLQQGHEIPDGEGVGGHEGADLPEVAQPSVQRVRKQAFAGRGDVVADAVMQLHASQSRGRRLEASLPGDYLPSSKR